DLKLRAEFLKGHLEQLKSDVQSAQMEIADYDFIYRDKLLEVFNVFHQHRTSTSNTTRHSVVSNTTRHSVVSNATRHSVVSNATRHSVVSNATRHSVVSNATRHSVVSNATRHSVVSTPPDTQSCPTPPDTQSCPTPPDTQSCPTPPDTQSCPTPPDTQSCPTPPDTQSCPTPPDTQSCPTPPDTQSCPTPPDTQSCPTPPDTQSCPTPPDTQSCPTPPDNQQCPTLYDTALRNYFQLLNAVSLRDNNFTLELLRKEPTQDDKKSAQVDLDLSDVSKCSGDNSNTSMSNAAVFHASVTQPSVISKVTGNGQGVSINSNHQKLLNNAKLSLPSPSLEASPSKSNRSPARAAAPDNNAVVLIRVREESYSSSSREREFSEKSSQTETSAAQRAPDAIEYKQSTAPGEGHRTIVLESDSVEPKTVKMREGKLEMDVTGDIASDIISRKYAEHQLQELGRQMTEIKVERGLIAKYSREPLDKGCSDDVLNGDPSFDNTATAFEKGFSPLKKKKPADEQERNFGGRAFGMSLKSSLPNVKLSENYEIPSTSRSHHGLQGHPHFVTSQQELRVSELISKYATPKLKTLGTNYNNCETIEERHIGVDGIRDMEDELKFENTTDNAVDANADLQSRIVKICAVRPIYPDSMTTASKQKQHNNTAEAHSALVSPESDDSRFAYLKSYEVTAGLFTVPKENLPENCSGNNEEFHRIHFQDHKQAENGSLLSKDVCSNQRSAYDRKSPQGARTSDDSPLELSRLNTDKCSALPRQSTEVNRTTASCNMFQQECQRSTDDSSEEETIPKTLYSHSGQRNGAYEAGLVHSGTDSDELTSSSQHEDSETFSHLINHQDSGYIKNTASPRPLKSSLKKDIQRYSDQILPRIPSFVEINPIGGFTCRELRDFGRDPRLFLSGMGLGDSHSVGEQNGAQDSRPSSRIAKRVRFDYIVTFNDNTQIDTQLAQLERELDECNDSFTDRCNRNGNNGNDMDGLSHDQGRAGEDYQTKDEEATYDFFGKLPHENTMKKTSPLEYANSIRNITTHNSAKYENSPLSVNESSYNEAHKSNGESSNEKRKGSVYFTLECSIPNACPIKWTHTNSVRVPRKRIVFYSAYRFNYASKERHCKMHSMTRPAKIDSARHSRFTDTCHVQDSNPVFDGTDTPDKGIYGQRNSKQYDGVQVDKSIEARLFRKILKCKTTLLKVWRQRSLKVCSGVIPATKSTKSDEKFAFDDFIPTERSYDNVGYLFSPEANCKKTYRDLVFNGYSLQCDKSVDGAITPQLYDGIYRPHLSISLMKPTGGACEISESTFASQTTHQTRIKRGWKNAIKRISKRKVFIVRKLCDKSKARDWPNHAERSDQGLGEFQILTMRKKRVKYIRGKKSYVNHAFHLCEDIEISKKSLKNTIENDGETWEDIVINSDNDSDEECCWPEKDICKDRPFFTNIDSQNVNNSALVRSSNLMSRSSFRKLNKKYQFSLDTKKRDTTSRKCCQRLKEQHRNLDKITSLTKSKTTIFPITRVRSAPKTVKQKTTIFTQNVKKSAALKNRPMKLLSRNVKPGQHSRSLQTTLGMNAMTELGQGSVYLQRALLGRLVPLRHSKETFRDRPPSQGNLVTGCKSWTMLSMAHKDSVSKPRKSASFTVGTEVSQVNLLHLWRTTPLVRKRPNALHPFKKVIHFVPWGSDDVHEKRKSESSPSPLKITSLPLTCVHVSPKSSPNTFRRHVKLKDLKQDDDPPLNVCSKKLNIDISSNIENSVVKTSKNQAPNTSNRCVNSDNFASHENTDIQKIATWRTTGKPQWQSVTKLCQPSQIQSVIANPEAKSCIKLFNLELVATESSYFHKGTKPISGTSKNGSSKYYAPVRGELSAENGTDPIQSLLSERMNPIMFIGDSQITAHGDSTRSISNKFNKDALGKSPNKFTGVVEALVVISKPLRLLPRERPTPRMCPPQRSRFCNLSCTINNDGCGKNKVAAITPKQSSSYVAPIVIPNFRLNSNNGKFNLPDTKDLKVFTTECDERKLPLEILRSVEEDVCDMRHVGNLKIERTIPSEESLVNWKRPADQQTFKNQDYLIALSEDLSDINEHSGSNICAKVCSNSSTVDNEKYFKSEPMKFVPLENCVFNRARLDSKLSRLPEPCQMHGEFRQLRPRNGKSQTKKSLAEARKSRLQERTVVRSNSREWPEDIDKSNGSLFNPDKFGDFKYTEDKLYGRGTNMLNDRYGDLVPANTPMSLSLAESSSTLVEQVVESTNVNSDRLTIQPYHPNDPLSSAADRADDCEKTVRNNTIENIASGKLLDDRILLQAQSINDSSTSKRHNVTNDVSVLADDAISNRSSPKSIRVEAEPDSIFQKSCLGERRWEPLLINEASSDNTKLNNVACIQRDRAVKVERSVSVHETLGFDNELQKNSKPEQQLNGRVKKGRRSKRHRRSDFCQPNEAKNYFLSPEDTGAGRVKDVQPPCDDITDRKSNKATYGNNTESKKIEISGGEVVFEEVVLNIANENYFANVESFCDDWTAGEKGGGICHSPRSSTIQNDLNSDSAFCLTSTDYAEEDFHLTFVPTTEPMKIVEAPCEILNNEVKKSMVKETTLTRFEMCETSEEETLLRKNDDVLSEKKDEDVSDRFIPNFPFAYKMRRNVRQHLSKSGRKKSKAKKARILNRTPSYPMCPGPRQELMSSLINPGDELEKLIHYGNSSRANQTFSVDQRSAAQLAADKPYAKKSALHEQSTPRKKEIVSEHIRIRPLTALPLFHREQMKKAEPASISNVVSNQLASLQISSETSKAMPPFYTQSNIKMKTCNLKNVKKSEEVEMCKNKDVSNGHMKESENRKVKPVAKKTFLDDEPALSKSLPVKGNKARAVRVKIAALSTTKDKDVFPLNAGKEMSSSHRDRQNNKAIYGASEKHVALSSKTGHGLNSSLQTTSNKAKAESKKGIGLIHIANCEIQVSGSKKGNGDFGHLKEGKKLSLTATSVNSSENPYGRSVCELTKSRNSLTPPPVRFNTCDANKLPASQPKPQTRSCLKGNANLQATSAAPSSRAEKKQQTVSFSEKLEHLLDRNDNLSLHCETSLRDGVRQPRGSRARYAVSERRQFTPDGRNRLPNDARQRPCDVARSHTGKYVKVTRYFQGIPRSYEVSYVGKSCLDGSISDWQTRPEPVKNRSGNNLCGNRFLLRGHADPKSLPAGKALKDISLYNSFVRNTGRRSRASKTVLSIRREFRNMNKSQNHGFSPLRAKRRQSDAKWRASVATCYDALKYVVPNVQNLSKRKISKALILQESEKHIKDLETAISYMLNIECESKGKQVLWKERVSWSHCDLEKLRADFSEKQQKIFHTSTHGRRCYNLLHDIKEDVFSMQADPERLAFVSDMLEINCDGGFVEDALVSDNKNTTYVIDGNILKPLSVAPVDMSTKLNIEGKAGTKDVSRFSQMCLDQKQVTKIRQQPRPKHKMMWDVSVSNELKEKISSDSHSPYVQTYMRKAPQEAKLSIDEQLQIVPSLMHDSSAHTYTTESAPLTLSSSVGSMSSTFNRDHYVHPNLEKNFQIKVENDEKNSDNSSLNEDYTYLLKALKSDREQEVPLSTTPIKSFRQNSMKSTMHFQTDKRKNERESTAKQINVNKSYQVVVSCGDTKNLHKTVGRRISTVPHSSTQRNDTTNISLDPVISPVYDLATNLKKEIIDPFTPMTGGDPLLSSICSPRLHKSPQLVSNFDTDVLTNRPTKAGSARKKLNFNITPNSGANIHPSSDLQSPNRFLFSSPTSGFTPVKLPDDFTMNSDLNNSLDYLGSPWKVLNSPFGMRLESQSYGNSTLTGLEDSLLCFESIDSTDLEESGEVFYELSTAETMNNANFENCHVVPQIEEELSDKNLEIEWETKFMTSSLKENLDDVSGCSDFDGFYLYYCQVNQQLKDKTDCHEVPINDVTAKVANIWTKLSNQDKTTLATLANLELQENDSCSSLSQDLADVKVEPLDPRELITTLND
ncbi:hypothetical protein Btru_076010, partial [Bulinus truncatus]